jgi:hypothetical protein
VSRPRCPLPNPPSSLSVAVASTPYLSQGCVAESVWRYYLFSMALRDRY